MDFEKLENLGGTPEAVSDAAGAKLAGFQCPAFSEMMEIMEHDLTPRIRFTTDAAEAVEAAKADRSDPFDLPDAVFYVEASETAQEEEPVKAFPGMSSFQNSSFVNVNEVILEAAREESSGAYVGPSIESIDLEIEAATRDLTFAQEQLTRALATGTGVLTAQRNVESAQAVLEAALKLHEEAVKFRAP